MSALLLTTFVTEKDAFEDMRMKASFRKLAWSPGESSALASITDVRLHISALADVVFYGSITTERAVGRGSEGLSNCTL